MSMVYELTYFIGFQVKHLEDSIFIYQSEYPKNNVEKFGLENTHHKSTIAATQFKLSKYEQWVYVDL